MAFTANELTVVNQALARIGAKRLASVSDITSNEYNHTDLIYDQTRDALLRSFDWNFACTRKVLTYETTGPDFEYDYKYKLPTDYSRLRRPAIYGSYGYVIEGDYILTNDTEFNLKYIKKVTDPAEFDELFTEVLVLTLAKKLIPALAGTKSQALMEDVKLDLLEATKRAKGACRSENDIDEDYLWVDARYGDGKIV